MSQLSFFSAESVPPAVADLTGLLAAPGQVVVVRGGARLSVVVDRQWRAVAIAEMIVEAGLEPEIGRTDENSPLVRTSVDPRLADIATEWTRGSGQDRAAAVVARAARIAGLDAGGWQPRGRPLFTGPRSPRPGHPFPACLGPDEGRDRADSDRNPGRASSAPGSAVADAYRAW